MDNARINQEKRKDRIPWCRAGYYKHEYHARQRAWHKSRQSVKKIEKAIKQGKVERLIIGWGKKVGTRKYRITEMTEAWDVVMLNGVLCKATLDVTFEEYVG